MATNYESAPKRIQKCKKHDLTIDMTCEDCDEFICSQCAKSDHKDHDWNTIPSSAEIKRKNLRSDLLCIKEYDVETIDEQIQMAAKHKEAGDAEISKLLDHFKFVQSKLLEVYMKYRTILQNKNEKIMAKELEIKEKKETVMDLIQLLEGQQNVMSDFDLINNFRDLTNLTSNTSEHEDNMNYTESYIIGIINEEFLKSMMGTFDDIFVAGKHSFHFGNEFIKAIDAKNEDTCYVVQHNHIKKVNQRNKKRDNFAENVSDISVTDNGDVYATDLKNKSIVRLSPSGLVSTVFSTAPLTPGGICQSTEGGLLVTLIDPKPGLYQPDSHSRRLVRHVALTGDVIREYEYQEDGRTRLFTYPRRVKQNGNSDICVVNATNDSASELVILYSSGSLKSVYSRQDMKDCILFDLVCDSHCNIIVCDPIHSQLHFLSPDGEFKRYLLTGIKVTHPLSMSLYESTLWVGDEHGLVKVFDYKT